MPLCHGAAEGVNSARATANGGNSVAGTSLIDTIAETLAPVHRDGHKFVGIALGLALLFFLIWPPLGWLLSIVTLYVAYFFRDPDRVTPLREGLVVAPADGTISLIEKVKLPTELGMQGEERIRVSIFLSVLNVHIQRAPVAGRITKSLYVPGAFINAAADKASEDNERRTIVIETANGVQVVVMQIAGLIARRIVTFATEGESVGVGQRFGLIRFGSRVDLYLPPGVHPLVNVGQTAIGGETVIADMKSSEPEREARRS